MHNGTPMQQVLVHWDQLLVSNATWEDYHNSLIIFPNFNLEDNVAFKGDGVVAKGNAKSVYTSPNPHKKVNLAHSSTNSLDELKKKGNLVRDLQI